MELENKKEVAVTPQNYKEVLSALKKHAVQPYENEYYISNRQYPKMTFYIPEWLEDHEDELNSVEGIAWGMGFKLSIEKKEPYLYLSVAAYLGEKFVRKSPDYTV